MKTSDIILVLTACLASGVEAVEALTVMLATGVTRGWRSTLIGAGAALLVLAGLIVTLGPALASVPIDTLRLVIASSREPASASVALAAHASSRCQLGG